MKDRVKTLLATRNYRKINNYSSSCTSLFYRFSSARSPKEDIFSFVSVSDWNSLTYSPNNLLIVLFKVLFIGLDLFLLLYCMFSSSYETKSMIDQILRYIRVFAKATIHSMTPQFDVIIWISFHLPPALFHLILFLRI